MLHAGAGLSQEIGCLCPSDQHVPEFISRIRLQCWAEAQGTARASMTGKILSASEARPQQSLPMQGHSPREGRAMVTPLQSNPPFSELRSPLPPTRVPNRPEHKYSPARTSVPRFRFKTQNCTHTPLLRKTTLSIKAFWHPRACC